jgi:hypothetical protein
MKATILMLTVIVLILSVILGFLIFKLEYKPAEIPEETAIQLAKQTTIIRPSFATVSEIDKLLKGTRMAGLGWALKMAEEETGIGVDFMYALAKQESSLGNANNWSLPPYNNPYSWDITESGPGLESKFNSIADCILFVAQKLKKNYLTPGAVYYKGETPQSVAVYYCGGDDVAWYTGILSGMKTFQSSLPENSRAKIWAMETGIIKGNLPAPLFFTNDYWQHFLTPEELAIYFYRINGR